jgi:hypothetical protein
MGDAMSDVMIPVFDSFDEDDRNAVMVILPVFHWLDYFEQILLDNILDLHMHHFGKPMQWSIHLRYQ